jgi:crotonobetainyl-CoA:carnitine CoA-transferase CaiB-like acyl-CoA transferase
MIGRGRKRGDRQRGRRSEEMSGALDGVTIVDLTSVGMGPMATQLLADMGADVIKVEAAAGDVFRHVVPQRHHGMGHPHLNLNRNKRSVVLDLKARSGIENLLALIARADVFISNMRAPAMRRLGLDAETLTKKYPRLIYCGCYGYSEKGPYAGRAAVDDTIQAASGLAWLQGSAGNEPPCYVKSVVADKVLALYVAQAVTAALFARERTSKGQAVEVPMFECMVSFLAVEHLAGKTFVPAEGPTGYSRLLNEFRRPFRTTDGYIGVVPYTDGQWRRFFEIIGAAELASDERYRTQAARSRHFGQLYEIIDVALKQKSTAAWIALLEDADIPFAPVNSLDDLLDDPHLAAIGFWRKVDHPSEGALIQAGLPISFSATPMEVRRHAPAIGEHTEEVLAVAAKAGKQ